MIQMISQYVVSRMQDERGAELVEWVVWVAALAGVGAAAAVVLSGGLTTAMNTILTLMPGGS
jgi:Flp pilus assembly pilin Flp